MCQEVDESAIQQDPDVELTMDSLWGVFWIIYYGFAMSALLLIFEWFVSGTLAVQPGIDGVSVV